MIDDIKRARQKKEDADEHGPWVVASVMCLVCQTRHVSVHPVSADENTLECPCGARMSEVIKYHPAPADAPAAPPPP